MTKRKNMQRMLDVLKETGLNEKEAMNLCLDLLDDNYMDIYYRQVMLKEERAEDLRLTFEAEKMVKQLEKSILSEDEMYEMMADFLEENSATYFRATFLADTRRLEEPVDDIREYISMFFNFLVENE